MSSKVSVGTIDNDMPIIYTLTQQRAGIFPYRIDDTGIYITVGIDEATKEITDGGGRPKPTDRSSLVTAIREFQEETHGVFGEITVKQLGQSISVFREDILITFVHMNYDFTAISKEFEKRQKMNRKNELSGLIEVNIYEFLDLIRFSGTSTHKKCIKGVMYEYIRILLRDALAHNGNFLI